ncbi:MAG: VWA domain-containing protein [Burkholderiales bacterium]|nr:VWA domain-containing protein [Burkholderiales bacterium]
MMKPEEAQDGVDSGARRWRLVLGGSSQEEKQQMSRDEQQIDAALSALYDADDTRSASLGKSAMNVARWLGDIRGYFPASVVKVMQQDALTRLNLHSMLLQPELMQSLTPDVHLAANLIALSKAMPEKVKETARLVVRKVVDDLEQRLAQPMRSAVLGSVNRHQRNMRPRPAEIDWQRTIRANLRHYQPQLSTIVVQQLIGFGRRRSSMRDIVLCIDQSGSMASSVVYASVFGAVLASLRAVTTKMVVFDTAVADLSEQLQDPVDVLFGIQLGGGTDINLALGYCQSIVTRPQETIMVLISDLFEGGNANEMLARAAQLVTSGVQLIALLALDDSGKPSYDHKMAQAFANLGIPAFACTPDLFPELMAALINRQDVALWAAQQDIVLA